MGKPIVLDGSSDCRSVSDTVEAAIDDPNIDQLVISGIDLECDIASSLVVLFKQRTHPWAEIVIRKCMGPISGLLTLILEQSKAHVNALQLDNTIGELGVSNAIQKGLRNNGMVKEIVLTNSRLSGRAMDDLIIGVCEHTPMRNLLFIGCEFQTGAAEALSKKLQNAPHLQDLSLYGSQIDDCDLASVVDSCYNLTALDMGHTDCGPKTIARLGHLLSSSENCKAESLDLNCHRHLGTACLSVEDLSPLFLGIQSNDTLRHLDITSFPLDEPSTRSLVSCLQNNTTLESLVLTDCGLSKVSLTLLLEHLSAYRGIRRLFLDGRHKLGLYGRQEWTEVATKALRTKNVALEALCLPPGFDFYRSELDVLLDRNLAGRRLFLKEKIPNSQSHQTQRLENPSALWPYVLRRINKMKLPNGYQQKEKRKAVRRTDMTFYMLRQHILLEA